jgi:hypothetical protein
MRFAEDRDDREYRRLDQRVKGPVRTAQYQPCIASDIYVFFRAMILDAHILISGKNDVRIDRVANQTPEEG